MTNDNMNEANKTRVDSVLEEINFDSFRDVLVIGILPNGMLDIKPSIAQYPWVHWILNKTANELWMLERNEIEARARAEAQVVEATGTATVEAVEGE